MPLLSLNGLQKKTSAVFEVAEVVPVMTNNYEESILKGARVGMTASLIYALTGLLSFSDLFFMAQV